MGIPNLVSFDPVAIFSCVFTLIFGLTLIATGTLVFNSFAILIIFSISEYDSALICLIPFLIASLISSVVFPTPEKTIF